MLPSFFVLFFFSRDITKDFRRKNVIFPYVFSRFLFILRHFFDTLFYGIQLAR